MDNGHGFIETSRGAAAPDGQALRPPPPLLPLPPSLRNLNALDTLNALNKQ